MSRVDFKIYANVACLCRLFTPMLYVEFKKWPYCMSNLRNGPVASISSMSHVEFKKWPCHPVDFRGLWP